MRAAASRTFCTAGNSRPIKIAIIAITTRSSMSVNPPDADGRRLFWDAGMTYLRQGWTWVGEKRWARKMETGENQVGEKMRLPLTFIIATEESPCYSFYCS